MVRHGESPGGGQQATPEYRCWLQMRFRCAHPVGRNAAYEGIRVCGRWDVYENFLADMGRRPSPGHSIERKDASRNYEPDNCVWATATEQSRNRPGFVVAITIDGKTQCLTAWCEELGIVSRVTAAMRVHRGWDPVRAVTTPARPLGFSQFSGGTHVG